MIITDNALNALTACEYRGIGKGWVNTQLRGGETIARIVSLIGEKCDDASVADFELKRNRIRAEIERLGDAIDGVVGIGDENFPKIRSSVKVGDRPVALFYRGDISLIRTVEKNVAVIGMLEPSDQIEREERAVVRQLVEQGMCIVSGLAHGCDTIGHKECLEFNGKTVAFLSSPLTQINPPSNRPLADEIVWRGGLLVSEYFRDVHSRREFIGRYAERDRLQSMFAGAVVLAASYAQRDYGKDSGSRFAMGKAVEYKVPRYVIYNEKRDASNPMYNLSRDEIATGAKTLTPNNFRVNTVGNDRQLDLFSDGGI